MLNRVFALVLATLIVLSAAPGANTALAQEKPALDHSAYEIWRGIGETVLSRDGAWIAYQITLENGDPELVVRATDGDAEHRVARGGGVRFTANGSHAVFLIAPARDELRQARLDEVPGPRRPKSQLGVLTLADGSLRTVDRVQSFRVPEQSGGWVAWLHEAEAPAENEEDGAGEQAGAADLHDRQEPAAEASAEAAEETPKKDAGTTLVLLDLASGAEFSFDHVIDYAAGDQGDRLVYATSTEDGSGDGVWLVDPASAAATPLLEGAGHYRDLALDRQGRRVAFLSDRDEYGADTAAHELWLSTDGGTAAKTASSADLGDDWWVSEHHEPSFSHDGTRLFFGSAPQPAPEPDEEPMLDEERVRVDIWHWQDPLLQPEQLLEADDERDRSYLAVVHVDSGAVVQLADRDLPDVRVQARGDGPGHGVSALAYRMERSWDSPGRADHYLVDVATGERSLIRQGQRGPVEMSPDGRWFLWWDETALAWRGRDLAGGAPDGLNLTAAIGHPVHDEDHDWAYEPQPYGIAGWLQAPAAPAGVEVVVYDRYDLWAVDPAGQAPPRALTGGAGRADALRLRTVHLDPESEWMAADSLLLAGFDEVDKDAGFWRTSASAESAPTQLVRADKRFGRPMKADDAALVAYTREDVAEFPDLWVAGLDFAAPRKVSEVNPQQADYNWATAEVTTWRSLDGEVLQGLVHKPENFDPAKKYPMMVTFYERNSDNLHLHHAPTPHRSVIRQTFYASRGYVVFTPDITYQVGYPGESALKDVVSGVLHMIDQGYVDENAIGTQGHSWGGYQIAYMVTKTDIFKAAAGGAPVSNMTSAYGGIRWGSGLSRMFQYEKTQSRIGATLWEAPLRYLENSPLFWADKVETPLMMMHNDHDGAVPWYQGIEMFVALRRLGKPAWLINYNDEPHWPTTYANKVDWNIRMQQFFDHYLKGAPAPVWLAEGIPAVDKGRTLGLELQEQ